MATEILDRLGHYDRATLLMSQATSLLVLAGAGSEGAPSRVLEEASLGIAELLRQAKDHFRQSFEVTA